MKVGKLLVGAAAAALLSALSPAAAQAAPPGPTARYGEPPYGSLDTVEAVAGQIHVTGWAIDPDGPGASYVQIDVIGGGSHTVFASEYRGDVGYHGFDYTIAATDGNHTVCVTALDYDHEAPDTSLGCGVVNLRNQPFGSLDVVERIGPAIRAGGWAIDPNTRLPVTVHTYVDGVFAGARNADEFRSDIAAIYPEFGGNHAYNSVVEARVGTHNVCVYAINVGPGSNTLLGCRSVTISSEPSGAYDGLQHVGADIHLSGWAIDPDTVDPIDVHVYIDGAFATAVRADNSRPDLLPFFPSFGPRHGYDITVPNRPGSHSVCVYAINAGPPAGNPLIGCRSV